MEAPPELRKIEKSLLYTVSTIRNTENPASRHIDTFIENLKLNAIIKVPPCNFQPWNTTLNIKGHTNLIIHKKHKYEILQAHENSNIYYTDASKSNKGMGIVIIQENLIIRNKLLKHYSIYTAETIAILKTIKYIHVAKIHSRP